MTKKVGVEAAFKGKHVVICLYEKQTVIDREKELEVQDSITVEGIFLGIDSEFIYLGDERTVFEAIRLEEAYRIVLASKVIGDAMDGILPDDIGLN